MTRRMARNLGELAADTPAVMQMGPGYDPRYAETQSGPGFVGAPLIAYKDGVPTYGPVAGDSKNTTLMIIGAVALGLLLFGGLGKKH